MKIKTIISNGLAIDCRTVVRFNEGEILGVGDKSTAGFSGLSEDNLLRLVDIGFAEDITEGDEGDVEVDETLEVEPEVVEEVEAEETEESTPEYMSFTNKADLEQYAREAYGIELDRRLSLKKMVKQLEEELGGDL